MGRQDQLMAQVLGMALLRDDIGKKILTDPEKTLAAYGLSPEYQEKPTLYALEACHRPAPIEGQKENN